jgi:hypothetical protein
MNLSTEELLKKLNANFPASSEAFKLLGYEQIRSIVE